MRKNSGWIAAAGVTTVLIALALTRPWEVTPLHGNHVSGQANEYYTCPMHPSVVSDRPGACPVCGMALVKKSSVATSEGELDGNVAEVSLSPAQRVIANVSTVAVERRPTASSVSAVGIVLVAEPLQATVTARFRGRIERLHVNAAGLRVRKGDPLFEMYSPDLVTAQREYLLARSAGGGESESSLVAASRQRLAVHFGMAADQIAATAASGEVTPSMTFRAPLGGTVIRKDVIEGEYVDEGRTLYLLADLSRVWVVLDVYENDIGRIRIQQNVAVETETYPGETFRGRVTFIDPIVNPESRTIRVRTELPNTSGRLRPNMFVRGTIVQEPGMALSVPTSALLLTGKRAVVWVETGPNVFVPRFVVAGAKSDQYTEIISGLRAGEMVAVTGGFLLDSESRLSQPNAPDEHAAHK